MKARTASIARRLTGVLARLAGAGFLVVLMAAIPARATIRYEVSLANPSDHIFRVQMVIPNVRGGVTVQMAAWNTLYQIRDFAYHVTELHATDNSGLPLHAQRLDKETWRIEGSAGDAASGTVHVDYSTYWNEAGPFGTQLNNEHAFLNLAMVLCYVPDRRGEDTRVTFTNLPAGWKTAMELPRSADLAGSAAEYVAASYDAMVDAPAEIGRFEEMDFDASNHPIRVIVHGETGDRAKLRDEITRIVEYEVRMMGRAPFTEYMFIYHIGRDYGGGGMEHSNSTAIAVSSPGALLNVSAHEFFHLWNVKRIRPQSLEPVDYTREMFTRALWFAEGVTNTYASYTLVRTGLWSRSQFYGDLTEQINELESRPARRWQSVEESSLDAWFEEYPMYDTPDFSISYYNKGQLLGFGLDIFIRDATNNKASLDDVLRRLNQEYAQRGRFYDDSAGIQGVVEEVLRDAGVDKKAALADFFKHYVAGTDELPFNDWLAKAGLTLDSRGQKHATFGFAITRNAAGAAVVSDLDLGSAAARAGLREGDLLVTVDGSEAPRNVQRWLRGHKPGDVVRAHFRRDDSENDAQFALGEESAHDYSVEEMPQPSAKQRMILNGLLQGTMTGRTPIPAR